jgi:hypothetical protein
LRSKQQRSKFRPVLLRRCGWAGSRMIEDCFIDLIEENSCR